MAGDVPSRRRVIREDQKAADRDRGPAEALASDRGGQPNLLVVAPMRRLDRCEHRLHLDDEKCPPGWKPPQDVDGTAFSELRVRDLDFQLPSSCGEAPDHGLDERSVPFVEQPVELTSAPGESDVKAGVKSHRESVQRDQVDALQPPSFDPRDRLLTEPSRPTEVALAPTPSTPERSDHTAEPYPFHRAWSMDVEDCRGLRRELSCRFRLATGLARGSPGPWQRARRGRGGRPRAARRPCRSPGTGRRTASSRDAWRSGRRDTFPGSRHMP
jgi:hypothetical protein